MGWGWGRGRGGLYRGLSVLSLVSSVTSVSDVYGRGACIVVCTYFPLLHILELKPNIDLFASIEAFRFLYRRLLSEH